MRQATKGHGGCACAGKYDFVARKTLKRQSGKTALLILYPAAFFS